MLGRFRGMALSADAGLASIDKTRRLPLTETAIGGRRAMVRPVERKRLNVFKGLKPILYGGREVWPLVEGGKGVSATNHMSSGAWAAAGGIGTVSAVNADSYDAEGKIIPPIYRALTRRERHEELVQYAIAGAVEQVRRAYEIGRASCRERVCQYV